ncbi:Cytochrome c oxidase assembly protein cox18, mitochondrial [Phlyctochytrium bullatum]|nr:Cytochrome c oxidase assembly protein cox18, mitochondrial [Phlyctochytrium bullatum]
MASPTWRSRIVGSCRKTFASSTRLVDPQIARGILHRHGVIPIASISSTSAFALHTRRFSSSPSQAPSAPELPVDPIATASWFHAPLEVVVSFFSALHDGLGLVPPETVPWYAAIIAGTALLRLGTVPIAVIQRRRIARLVKAQSVVAAWEATLRRQPPAPALNPAERAKKLQTQYKAKVAEVYRTYNCQPWKTFLLPWTQLPLFVAVSFGLRRMAAFPAPFLETPPAPVPGFAEEGVLWFANLAAPDPTVLLPLAIGGMHLFNIEMNSSSVKKPTARQRALKIVFQTLAVASVPIATQVPAGIALYWATSAAFSVVQNVVLNRVFGKRK